MLAISPQDVESHRRFAEQEGFTFALLADPELRVITEYGVRGGSRIGVKRSIFLLDAEGIVRWRFVGAIRAIFKKPRHLARVLEEM